MAFESADIAIGYPPIEEFLPATAILAGLPAGSTYPPQTGGALLTAKDSVWGTAEFFFARANATIPIKALCSFLPVWNSTTRTFDWNAVPAANATLAGRPVGVCMAEQPVVGAVNALTAGQFGWFMVTGNYPVNGTASVAADTTCGITAAGQIGAVTAGKQIVNARVITPATQTVVVASVSGVSGGDRIVVANTDGLFVGGYLSGTGVGASAIIRGIDRIKNELWVSVVNSAAVTGNVTQTANNSTIFYNVLNMNRAFAQGQIT
jgi:hypothetical protein